LDPLFVTYHRENLSKQPSKPPKNPQFSKPPFFGENDTFRRKTAFFGKKQPFLTLFAQNHPKMTSKTLKNDPFLTFFGKLP
jgi:hypothetical protein